MEMFEESDRFFRSWSELDDLPLNAFVPALLAHATCPPVSSQAKTYFIRG
jgi:hypothetical protein